MAEVLLFGEPMAMFVAKTAGELYEAEEFTRFLAGAEVNVAIGLKRLGHSVSYITKLGTDPFGTYIEQKLHLENVNPQIFKDQDHSTGFLFKNKVLTGDPSVLYHRKNSAASHLTEEEVDSIDFSNAKLLHITGIMPALSLSCRNATYKMIEKAREHGLIVSFDPNLRPSLWESQSVMVRTINDIASRCDIVLPGENEGRILMGSEDAKAISAFYRNLGSKMVVVKLGARGAYIENESFSGEFKGFKVKEVVDTVGAGDGFAVGILSAYLEGLSPEKMVERANAIGAIQVSVESDNEGLPTQEELAHYIATAER